MSKITYDYSTEKRAISLGHALSETFSTPWVQHPQAKINRSDVTTASGLIAAPTTRQAGTVAWGWYDLTNAASLRVDFNHPVQVSVQNALGVPVVSVSGWYDPHAMTSMFLYHNEVLRAEQYTWGVFEIPTQQLLLDVNAQSVPLASESENWMARFLSLTTKQDKSDALQFLFARVDELSDAQKFDELDAFIYSFEPEPLPAEILVGLVRITFPFRDRLLHWIDALGFVYSILSRRGYDAKRTLGGLIA